MNVHDLLRNPPRLHEDECGNPISWKLSNEALYFIAEHVDEASNTLETGAGVSTVLFSLKQTNHICIVPDENQVNRIREYCMECKIPIDKINFHMEKSEILLPKLDIGALDLVLIDGLHSFPIPFIDWYYTSHKLNVGGYIIIDDTHLWTGDILKRFLLEEPEWKLESDFKPRTTVFKKVREGSHGKEWREQPYLVRKTDNIRRINRISSKISSIGRAFELLCKGEILSLSKKIIKNIR
jgi:hypothetical protein